MLPSILKNKKTLCICLLGFIFSAYGATGADKYAPDPVKPITQSQIPKEYKDLFYQYGTIVEFIRVCKPVLPVNDKFKTTSSAQEQFQALLKKKEPMLRVSMGINPNDFRQLMFEGSDAMLEKFKSYSDSEREQRCTTFKEGFPEYLAQMQKEQTKYEDTAINTQNLLRDMKNRSSLIKKQTSQPEKD